MIALDDFDKNQREAVMEHLVSLGRSGVRVNHTSSSVIVEADFPLTFFSDLEQRAVEATLKSARPRGGSVGGVRSPSSALGDSSDNLSLPPPIPDYDKELVKPLSWLIKTIEDFYTYRWTQFHLGIQAHRSETHPVVDDVSVHVFQYLSKRFGVTALVQKAAASLLESIKVYRADHLGVQMFGILLSSATFDTTDVQFYLQCRSQLERFVLEKQEPIAIRSLFTTASITERYVRIRDIPALLRKCLSRSHPKVLLRCRHALHTWCRQSPNDPSMIMTFPAVVPDPNFYAPPFPVKSPYVGNPHEGGSIDEGRFRHVASSNIVPESQLLTLLLLNFKKERLDPMPDMPKKRTASPSMVASPIRRPPTSSLAASMSIVHFADDAAHPHGDSIAPTLGPMMSPPSPAGPQRPRSVSPTRSPPKPLDPAAFDVPVPQLSLPPPVTSEQPPAQGDEKNRMKVNMFSGMSPRSPAARRRLSVMQASRAAPLKASSSAAAAIHPGATGGNAGVPMAKLNMMGIPSPRRRRGSTLDSIDMPLDFNPLVASPPPDPKSVDIPLEDAKAIPYFPGVDALLASPGSPMAAASPIPLPEVAVLGAGSVGGLNADARTSDDMRRLQQAMNNLKDRFGGLKM